MQNNRGFSLIELMIVITIIGLISTQAIPIYDRYITRAKFSQLQSRLLPLQLAISECLAKQGGVLSHCDSAEKIGFTLPQPENTTRIEVISETAAISVNTTASLQSKTFILSPTLQDGVISWQQSGSCLSAGVCS